MKNIEQNLLVENDKLIDLIHRYYNNSEQELYDLQRMFVEIVNSIFILPIKVSKSKELNDKENSKSLFLIESIKDNSKYIPIFTDLNKMKKLTEFSDDEIKKINYQEIINLLSAIPDVKGFVINLDNENLILSREHIQAINDEILKLKNLIKVDNGNLIHIIKEFIDTKGNNNLDEYINNLTKAQFLIPIKVKKPTVFAFIEDSIGFATIEEQRQEYYFPIFTDYDKFRNHYGYKGEIFPIIMTIQELSELMLSVNDKCIGIVINPLKENIVFSKEYLIGICKFE